MTKFRAYYPGATAVDVLSAQPKHFPLRATVAEAVQDVQDAWHKPGHFDYATHLTVFAITGDTARQMDVKVKRSVVVEGPA